MFSCKVVLLYTGTGLLESIYAGKPYIDDRPHNAITLSSKGVNDNSSSPPPVF